MKKTIFETLIGLAALSIIGGVLGLLIILEEKIRESYSFSPLNLGITILVLGSIIASNKLGKKLLTVLAPKVEVKNEDV